MHKVNEEKLRKAIAFVRGLKPEQFDFSSTVRDCDDNGCGTVCCFMGWMPMVFPDEVRWEYLCRDVLLMLPQYEGAAANIFSIDVDVADCLFTPRRAMIAHPSLELPGGDPDAAQVCDMLEAFIELVKLGEIPDHYIEGGNRGRIVSDD